MDVQAFAAWLTAFGDGWEQHDPDATAALFAPGATFQPSPFAELVRGRRQLAAHWAEVMAEQQAIRFQAEILGVGATYGIAHWRVVFGRGDTRTAGVVDGILLAAFDRRGRATSVRGWVARGDSTTGSRTGPLTEHLPTRSDGLTRWVGAAGRLEATIPRSCR